MQKFTFEWHQLVPYTVSYRERDEVKDLQRTLSRFLSITGDAGPPAAGDSAAFKIISCVSESALSAEAKFGAI